MGRDALEPRAEPIRRLQRVQAAQAAQQRLLRQVLGRVPIAHPGLAKRQHAARPAPGQLVAGGTLPC